MRRSLALDGSGRDEPAQARPFPSGVIARELQVRSDKRYRGVERSWRRADGLDASHVTDGETSTSVGARSARASRGVVPDATGRVTERLADLIRVRFGQVRFGTTPGHPS